jgi:RsiW-degrading membrane proteinase PrsW (M82 family)
LSETELARLLSASPHAQQLRLLYDFAHEADWRAAARSPMYAPADGGVFVATSNIRTRQGETETALDLYRQGLARLKSSDEAAGETGASPAGAPASATGERMRDARLGILNSLTELQWYAEFTRTMRDPEFYAVADDFHLYIDHLKTGNYLAMVGPLLRSETARYKWRWVIAALATGLCWATLLLHMGRAGHWSPGDFALALSALVLGGLSTYATIVTLLIGEEFVPLSRLTPTFFNELVHMILGVGLREELLKLLGFLPLVPFLLRKDKQTVLIIAACAGLGFATEENILYYADSSGQAIIARFLTANFFHMTLTGFAGYYLVLALRGDGATYSDFAAQFALVVLLHGAYDFLLGDRIANGQFFALMIHVWLAYQFLNLLMELDQRGRRRIPATYVFVGTMAILTGIGYLMLVPEFGLAGAAQASLLQLVDVATITLVFFVVFREPVG